MLPPLGGCRRLDADGLVAALVPDEADAATDSGARPDARHLRRPRPSRAHPPPPAGRRAAAPRARRAGAPPRRPQPRHRRRALRFARQAHAPGRRHRDPRQMHDRRSRLPPRALSPTAISRAPAEMERRFARLPDAIRASADIAERCTFSLRELSYQYPDEIVMSGRTPAGGAGAADPRRARRQISRTACREAYAELLEHELKLVGQLDYAPYFLTVNSIVAVRAQPGASSARAAARRPIR